MWPFSGHLLSVRVKQLKVVNVLRIVMFDCDHSLSVIWDIFFLSQMLSVSRNWLILKIISQSWLWNWKLSVKTDSDTENYWSVLVQRQIQYDFTNKNNNVSSEDHYIIHNPKYHSSSYWTCCDTCDDFCLDFYDGRYSIYISVLDWITNNLLFNRLVLG